MLGPRTYRSCSTVPQPLRRTGYSLEIPQVYRVLTCCLAWPLNKPRANGAKLAACLTARELEDILVFRNTLNPKHTGAHHLPSSMRDSDSSDSTEPRNEQHTPSQPARFGVLDFEASDDVKRWARRYRTELASMSSSMLSTFVAVRMGAADHIRASAS